MSITNKVSIVIDADALAAIKEAEATIRANLPKLITLSADDRTILPKMGGKTVWFVNKALGYAKQNPKIVPQYLDMGEFAKDVAAVNDLFEVLAPIQKLAEELDDTILLAGSEAYMAALAFYSALKGAIKAGEPGLKNIYDELSARFPATVTKNESK